MEWETEMVQLLHWRFQMMLISTECILSKGILPVAGRTQNYNFIHSYSICPFLTELAESGSALWLVAGPAVAVGIRMMISEQMLPKHRLMWTLNTDTIGFTFYNFHKSSCKLCSQQAATTECLQAGYLSICWPASNPLEPVFKSSQLTIITWSIYNL